MLVTAILITVVVMLVVAFQNKPAARISGWRRGWSSEDGDFNYWWDEELNMSFDTPEEAKRARNGAQDG